MVPRRIRCLTSIYVVNVRQGFNRTRNPCGIGPRADTEPSTARRFRRHSCAAAGVGGVARTAAGRRLDGPLARARVGRPRLTIRTGAVAGWPKLSPPMAHARLAARLDAPAGQHPGHQDREHRDKHVVRIELVIDRARAVEEVGGGEEQHLEGIAADHVADREVDRADAHRGDRGHQLGQRVGDRCEHRAHRGLRQRGQLDQGGRRLADHVAGARGERGVRARRARSPPPAPPRPGYALSPPATTSAGPRRRRAGAGRSRSRRTAAPRRDGRRRP